MRFAKKKKYIYAYKKHGISMAHLRVVTYVSICLSMGMSALIDRLISPHKSKKKLQQ